MISTIQDPEKPYSLEQLEVVQEDLIDVFHQNEEASSFDMNESATQVTQDTVAQANTDASIPHVQITWVPTVPNCHLALTIALSLKNKLGQDLADLGENIKNSKIDILVQDGKHDQQYQIDKQVNDKERVLAALEKENIQDAIQRLCDY